MVNLTAQTVKHFIPSATFHCVSFFKKNSSEYDHQEPLLNYISNEFIQTAYVNPENKPHDHIDNKMTSGFENKDNVKYFTEGYNYFFRQFKDLDEKILILSEDHFFTSGKTLEEITTNEFDVAYGPWDLEDDANGAILCLNFAKVGHLFPLPETGPSIEQHLRLNLIQKASKPYKITTRKHINYHGDGVYTNSSETIKEEIQKAGIL